MKSRTKDLPKTLVLDALASQSPVPPAAASTGTNRWAGACPPVLWRATAYCGGDLKTITGLRSGRGRYRGLAPPVFPLDGFWDGSFAPPLGDGGKGGNPAAE